MIYDIDKKVILYFTKGSARTLLAKKNIAVLFLLKGFSIVVMFVMIPMTINYVNPAQYGIWITISSMVSWMSFFDIGMGNGLRNKLASALALDEHEKANIYVSTTYALLLVISAVLLFVFFLINPLINWQRILNIPATVKDNINAVVLITFASFCIQFVVQIINVVLAACQQPAFSSLIIFLGQLGVLLAIFVLKHLIAGTLYNLVLIITLIPLAVLIIASIFLYSTRLKMLSPSFKKVDFKYAKNLLSLGGVFFIIQIGALLLYETDNIIITKVIGPESVTVFNIAYKLFSIVSMLFTIILTPYWSAFTDAYTKGDFKWMKESVYKVRAFWLFSSLVLIPILCLFSGFLYKFWIGNVVVIPITLSILMGFYTIASTGMILNCFFLNGIGKLRIQLYLYIVSCIINVPLSIYSASRFGIPGVVLVNTIIMFIMSAFFWVQTNKILENTAVGVWAK